MEQKKTYADIRREEFNKHAQAARELADLSLRDIDAVLAEEDRFIEGLHRSVEENGVDVDEAELLWNHFHRAKE